LPSTSSEHTGTAPSAVPPVPAPGRNPLSLGLAALETMRPYQWLKNALVFVPLAAAHRLGEGILLGAAARAFIAFTLCASSIYVINDLRDVGADRLHPHKRNRPIASGRLPPPLAAGVALLLLIGALLVVVPLGLPAALTLGAYFALMIAYSLRLKAIVLLDALVLAAGYALRVLEGGFAVHIRPSSRLLAFCIFLFFSLALIKRYAELALLRTRDGAAAHARAYLLEDQECVMALGCSSGILSVLVLALYMSAGNAERLYSRSEFIWCTAVLLLYWVSHMWLMAHRARMTDDPLVFALKDRVSRILILAMGCTAWLAV
jgi:4-hydroxybenzoate polyprenyltransferase